VTRQSGAEAVASHSVPAGAAGTHAALAAAASIGHMAR
jgi:hypothetical protein